ncbi:uncharacterized protein BCR38DRAFT_23150 [Pseudomassariella vexata]|uniref:Uncharacterized protein n=1 Tax=Pseudomassariella vexata TaxID=1141098 RepID=A0A1Y2EK61_9PEZI|nr:uncharacterized protein BCR38DRAFT_23150 [Pseudomassariella vexata]ORY71917.1 hypothetical protein BCR38DRAFT_23150 [Pseudomassariella vexata]
MAFSRNLGYWGEAGGLISILRLQVSKNKTNLYVGCVVGLCSRPTLSETPPTLVDRLGAGRASPEILTTRRRNIPETVCGYTVLGLLFGQLVLPTDAESSTGGSTSWSAAGRILTFPLGQMRRPNKVEEVLGRIPLPHTSYATIRHSHINSPPVLRSSQP